ncbi:Protein nud1 [Neurospora sp. IMI 360204]|nr:Protein nud1 [Neurospora sp. IMI 360204]
MGHAWLDSLSEDWPSQPGSLASNASQFANKLESHQRSQSQSKSISRPGTAHSRNLSQDRKPPKTPPSRIPRPNSNRTSANNSILHDDRVNSNTASNAASRRGSTKSLGDRVRDRQRAIDVRSRTASIAESVQSGGSVIHNTVNRKEVDGSPRRKQDTPEWKRRLVYRELDYGEAPDLFTSAGAILESIFKPPPPPAATTMADTNTNSNARNGRGFESQYESQAESHVEITLPSSPPFLGRERDPSTVEIHVEESLQSLPRILKEPEEEVEEGQQEQQRRKIPEIRYRRATDSTDPSQGSESSFRASTTQQQTSPKARSRTPSTSASSHLGNLSAGSRQASGQSVLRHEDFSPILLTMHDAGDGNSNFAPEISPDELRYRLETLRKNQLRMARTGRSDSGASVSGTSESGKSEAEAAATGGSSRSDNKAGDTNNTSKDYEKLGSYINVRRGGRSADASFQNHMLSSALNDVSELNPEESLQASTPKRFPSVRVEHWDDYEHVPAQVSGNISDEISPRSRPAFPRIPNLSAATKRVPSSQQGAGSPLKLFQPYDTFTSEILQRRLSQYDNDTPGEQASSGQQTGDESPVNICYMDSGGYLSPPKTHTRRGQETGQRKASVAVNHFGAGVLDGYEFQDEFSYQSVGASGVEGDKENQGPNDDSLPGDRIPVFDFSRPSSPSEAGADADADASNSSVRRKRQKPVDTGSSKRHSKMGSSSAHKKRHAFTHIPATFATPSKRRTDPAPEFKRPRTSPSKDPTPKRRRTLHESDIEFGLEDLSPSPETQSMKLSYQQIQATIDKRRKEVHAEKRREQVEPGTPSGKDVPRPRTPTPLQRSSLQKEGKKGRPPLTELITRSSSRPTRPSSKASSKGRAPKKHGAPGSAMNTDRKPSIKTEDFLIEANKIMAMIRKNAASGLTSVEESDEYDSRHDADGESSYEESTQESFLRPPSREGRPPLTRRSTKQEDPVLAERLKQYEEASDMGDIMGSSLRSAALHRQGFGTVHQDEKHHAGKKGGPVLPDFREDGVISDPPNIRISWNPALKTKLSHENVEDGRHTQSESDNYTGRSSHTTSSKGSDTRKTIAPESVLHLIPDRVGNMVLDRERNVWVRKRPSNGFMGSRQNSFIASEVSEDDPFADIPDLTVDITEELEKLRLTTNQRGQEQEQEQEHEHEQEQGQGDLPLDLEAPFGDDDFLNSEPQWQPTGSRRDSDTSNPGKKNKPTRTDEQRDAKPSLQSHTSTGVDVEHEIGIYEDRVSNTPQAARRRQLTISFSSPIASIIQDIQDVADNVDSDADAPSALGLTGGEGNNKQQRKRSLPPLPPRGYTKQQQQQQPQQPQPRGRRAVSISASKLRNEVASGSASRSRSRSRGPPRHLSVKGQTYMARPVSRIDEHDEESSNANKNSFRFHGHDRPSLLSPQPQGMELSIVAAETSMVNQEDHEAQQHNNSISFLVATPAHHLRPCSMSGTDPAHIISQYVGTFSLSPLSDFTIHPPDESSLALEASYIIGNHHLVTGDHHSRGRSMSMSTRDLVAKLTEVEPFEPYWEDMRNLCLAHKRLESLHALDAFCGRLESLDASHNEIRNLTGAPSTTRFLKMINNQLSSLTAWGHLINLQYVDISNNRLTSLNPFKQLVHLRELRVDNNRLESLEGIKFHDGLQVLRARGNCIEEVDFDGARLVHLTELDLRENKIKTVVNLDQLPVLSSLNLEGNQIDVFEVGSPAAITSGPNSPVSEHGQAVSSLRYLHLNDNCLSHLSIHALPRLRLLHADRNRLVRIHGFSRARHLDSLSLREQQGPEPLDLDHLLSRAYEVRKLFLSGNYLGSTTNPKGVEESGFNPRIDLLNLQLLELANCGLTKLPVDVGQMMPNLRVLNLNMNALEDLSPLRHVPRLKRLFVSGNRIRDLSSLVEVLTNFSCLTAVDLRGNGLVTGFYSPVQELCKGGAASLGKQNQNKSSNNMDEEAQKGQEADGQQDEHENKDQWTLPSQTPASDRAYSSRLDLQTKMRRRVYDHLLAEKCSRLKKVDGLPFDRDDVLGRRDEVWKALVARGVFSIPTPVNQNAATAPATRAPTNNTSGGVPYVPGIPGLPTGASSFGSAVGFGFGSPTTVVGSDAEGPNGQGGHGGGRRQSTSPVAGRVNGQSQSQYQQQQQQQVLHNGSPLNGRGRNGGQNGAQNAGVLREVDINANGGMGGHGVNGCPPSGMGQGSGMQQMSGMNQREMEERVRQMQREREERWLAEDSFAG